MKKPLVISERSQVVTYLVTIRTYGKRERVKASCGRTLARLLNLNFRDAEVQYVSKVDVPKTKPYEPAKLLAASDLGD